MFGRKWSPHDRPEVAAWVALLKIRTCVWSRRSLHDADSVCIRGRLARAEGPVPSIFAPGEGFHDSLRLHFLWEGYFDLFRLKFLKGHLHVNDHYHTMFSSKTASAAAPAAGGMFGNPLPAIAAQPAAPHGSGAAPDREKLEPRLSAMLMGQGVQESTLDTLGKVGILTVQVFANLAEKKEEMRKLLERDEIGIKSDSIQGALEQARVLGVWLATQTMLTVEAKHEAERAVTAQAPEISLKELVAQKQLFERSTKGFPLPPAMCPSKAFLERKFLDSRHASRPSTSPP